MIYNNSIKIFIVILFVNYTIGIGGQKDSLSHNVLKKLVNYNVTWDSPSNDFNGSMPIGNGDIGLNVWTENNGDLLFYIGKTDSWGDNGRLLKIGKVRIKISPSSQIPLKDFIQTLHLENSSIVVKYGEHEIKIWVDANNPVINVDINSNVEIEALAEIELWRTSQMDLQSIEVSDVMFDHNIENKQIAPTIVEPDSLIRKLENSIGWFHFNRKSIGPSFTAKQQGLENFSRVDPLLDRIFGAVITSSNSKKISNKKLLSQKSDKHYFRIYVSTEHPSSPNEWLNNLKNNIDSTEQINIDQRFENHRLWWEDFWNRSWIFVSSNNTDKKSREEAFTVTQSYILQRYINACNGRGQFPIKFNGSIFNVPFKDAPGDADYRRWGPGYWWQNSRLPYYSMCTSGDYDLMMPLFKMYVKDLFDLFKFRTKLYLNVDGIFIPECIYFWGDIFTASYGKIPFDQRDDKLQESRWHKYEWVSGLELTYLMLDYYEYFNDENFLIEYTLPFANQIITFFDQYYKTENGKLKMEPSQSAETWWKCTNPMPELAGLHSVLNRLIKLDNDLVDSEMIDYWQNVNHRLPGLPTHVVNEIGMLAPAEKFEEKMNIENPELYAVFPFQLINFNSEKKDLAINAFINRLDKGNWGWRQDDIFASYLGLSDTTKKYLIERSKNKNVDSRFPAFWGPNYDWTPDQTHGGVLMKTLQSMIMQCEEENIYLLPSWPKDWNVDFKLHAPDVTIVEGNYDGGQLIINKVTPEYRNKNISVIQ
ncbi:MAG: hypothetical protein H6610_07170 [Ignavibacteriales bacterium]|nr:hypothetical protein [Ignavibacteriales bacterium]